MTKTYVQIGGQTYDGSLALKDRTFRDAWKLDASPTKPVIVVDMDKARDIQRDRIRAERAPELARLDAQFMRALETGADMSHIAAAKQWLRDAPASAKIASAKTPDALAALTLDAL